VIRPDWIAVDWGTSALRVWAMGRTGAVLATANSDDGMGRLTPEAFEPALMRLIEPWLADAPTKVIACGMVGARQGWSEAPYRALPCPPLGTDLHRVTARDPRLDLRIIAGLSQAAPPDVMRGEETQIAGFLAQNQGFEGTLCLPGTHAKWVRLCAGRIEAFRTTMTGEIFALLSNASVLRHSVGSGWVPEAFAAAVIEAHESPATLTTELFALRAASLLHGTDPAATRSRLSGLLIGAELAATADFWRVSPPVLIGAPTLSRHYAQALAALGTTAQLTEGADLTLAGLCAAHASLTETETP